MDLNLPAIPCGLIAKSLFTDTFKLKKVSSTSSNEDEIIEIN